MHWSYHRFIQSPQYHHVANRMCCCLQQQVCPISATRHTKIKITLTLTFDPCPCKVNQFKALPTEMCFPKSEDTLRDWALPLSTVWQDEPHFSPIMPHQGAFPILMNMIPQYRPSKEMVDLTRIYSVHLGLSCSHHWCQKQSRHVKICQNSKFQQKRNLCWTTHWRTLPYQILWLWL